MGKLLRWGVVASAALIVAGAAMYLAAHGGEVRDLSRFRKADWSADTRIAQYGILLMIATPAARVVFAIYAFARERDWLYTAVSMAILALVAWGYTHTN